MINPKTRTHFLWTMRRKRKKFNIAARLATHKSLLNRTHNRPKLSDLETGKFNLDSVSDEAMEDIDKKAAKAYKELHQRLERERQLGVVQTKMEIKAALRQKVKPVKQIVCEDKNVAPVYLWPQER